MEKKTCAILGYGDRSSKYSKYALDYPEELQVIAVIDVAEHKLKKAKEVFNLNDDKLFTSLDEFLSKDIKCDFVINGTMDQLHYETSIKLLNKGYNLLLEKPITAIIAGIIRFTALTQRLAKYFELIILFDDSGKVLSKPKFLPSSETDGAAIGVKPPVTNKIGKRYGTNVSTTTLSTSAGI